MQFAYNIVQMKKKNYFCKNYFINMKKNTFTKLLIAFIWSNVCQITLATDYNLMKPVINLEIPELTPVPTYNYGLPFRPNTELSTTPEKTSENSPYRLTWMRTNPDVKSYKVMDDLTFVGVPLFVAGMIAKSEKTAFRQNDGTRHVLLTDFKTSIDDYAQFFGPVMTVGLKVAGVEGRSDWGRLLTSAGLSYGIMAAFVNGIKYTAKEMRPDGSTANSWPSGHTATAFVGATLLHKEYGLTRSPWYSVAGYGVATATGVMRVLNNRHWISDVLSGAGIGIMSGELAYALSDFIFKDKGLLRGDISADKSIIDNPSFFSISMGLGFGSKDIDFGEETNEDGDDFHMEFRSSTAVAAEGAYFFNKYFGVGGRLRVNSSPINGWNRVLDYANRDVKGLLTSFNDDVDLSDLEGLIFNTPDKKPTFTIESDHLTEFAADMGVYFNLPLSRRFALGAKLLAGRSIMQELNLAARYQGKVKDFSFGGSDDTGYIDTGETYDTTWDYFTLSANNSMKLGTGISLTYAYKNNFAWKLFFDYDVSRKTYTLEYDPMHFIHTAMPSFIELMDFFEIFDPEFAAQTRAIFSPITTDMKKNRHTFILGGSFVISF